MGSFLRDLRFGARALVRAPGFTAVALGATRGDVIRLVFRQGLRSS